MTYDNFLSYQTNPILDISIAERIKKQLEDGKFEDATNSWSELENVISTSSNNVVIFIQFLQMSSLNHDVFKSMLFLLSDTNTILTNVIAFYSNYD
jgi:ribosome-associated toxin RatA of RatAB toxin-antitoxin module